ncbi:hypothetical protein LXL04_008621 [Taraxacum kok-saghyz]
MKKAGGRIPPISSSIAPRRRFHLRYTQVLLLCCCPTPISPPAHTCMAPFFPPSSLLPFKTPIVSSVFIWFDFGSNFLKFVLDLGRNVFEIGQILCEAAQEESQPQRYVDCSLILCYVNFDSFGLHSISESPRVAFADTPLTIFWTIMLQQDGIELLNFADLFIPRYLFNSHSSTISKVALFCHI